MVVDIGNCCRVVVAAPKGGVGKTTLTLALLVLASKAGLRVCGYNTDEQMSLMKWDVRRRKQIASASKLQIADIPIRHMPIDRYRDLAEVTEFDIIIVDTPPGHANSVNSVISMCEMADIVLIPTGPATVDVDEVVPFAKSISGLKAYFVLNSVNRRAKSYAWARQHLLSKGRLCPADIPRLESIAIQYGQGLSCVDFDDAGCVDFRSVWNFLCHETGLKSATEGVIEHV